MDKLIGTYKVTGKDEDLTYCEKDGVAFQTDMSNLIEYGEEYFNNYVRLRGTKIAVKINDARVGLIDFYLNRLSTILDIGIGSGEFIDCRNKGRGPRTRGYDINPKGIEWLRSKRFFSQRDWNLFKGLTFWDSLEHIPDPGEYLARIGNWKWVFISIPIFSSMEAIKKSKHYKPGEHLYYFTDPGFRDYMNKRGFTCVEKNDMEVKAGRKGIKTYVFKKEI